MASAPGQPDESDVIVGASPSPSGSGTGTGTDGATPAAAAIAPPPVLVRRWIQLVMLPLAVLGLFELARAAGSVLLILMAACVVALILNPLAKLVERALPRGLAIAASYVVVAVILAGIVGLLSAPIANEVSHVANNFPSLVRKADRELQSVQGFLDRHHVHVQLQSQGHSALKSLEKRVLTSSGSIVSFSRDVLGKVVSLSVDLVLVFVLSVYLLVYARSIGELARGLMPAGDGTPDDDYPLLVQRGVSGYVRGQLLFSLIMGGSAGVALELLGVLGVFPDGARFALFFGIFYGLMELVPYVGPILGAVPPVLVALVTDPVSAIWLVLLFIALQQLEGHVIAPQVFRISLRINPIIVILSLLLGYQIYGVAGALVALPIATVIRQTILYLRAHLVLEPWGVPGSSP